MEQFEEPSKKKIKFSVSSILQKSDEQMSSNKAIENDSKKEKKLVSSAERFPRRLVYSVNGTASICDKAFGNVSVLLENAGLWQRFRDVGTEMVITKAGRRMFPPLKYIIRGLNPRCEYIMAVEICPADGYRYKYNQSAWCISGRAYPDVGRNYRMLIHPDSPSSGDYWNTNVVSFHKTKITNNSLRVKNQMILNSLQKYQPCLHVIRGSDLSGVSSQISATFVFPETCFIAVTAYQSEQITQLKIDNNPFAKGFRDPIAIHQRNNWRLMDQAWMFSNDQYRTSIQEQPPRNIGMAPFVHPPMERNGNEYETIEERREIMFCSKCCQEHPVPRF